MKNIFQIINNHNKEIIKAFHDDDDKIKLNSRMNCPMNGLCNLDNVVYQGIIYPKENVKDRKTFIGISPMKWKSRYYNQ